MEQTELFELPEPGAKERRGHPAKGTLWHGQKGFIRGWWSSDGIDDWSLVVKDQQE